MVCRDRLSGGSEVAIITGVRWLSHGIIVPTSFVPEHLFLQIMIIHLYLRVCLQEESLSYIYVVELCDRSCNFFVIKDFFLQGCDAVLSVCRLCSSFKCKELDPPDIM